MSTEEAQPPLTVHKMTAYIPVSCCLLTDTTGVSHCQHPPTPRPVIPWRRRARWWLSGHWSALRMRVGSWIAGVDLEEDE